MSKRKTSKWKGINYLKNWKSLESSGLEYVCFNQYHVRIQNCLDYWPSTEKYYKLGENESFRGSFKQMIKYLNSNDPC